MIDGKIHKYTLINCKHVILPETIFFYATHVNLTNIKKITTEPSDYPGTTSALTRWTEEIIESFHIQNCTVTKFGENLLKDLFFKTIWIGNSVIERLHHHAFRNTTVEEFHIFDTTFEHLDAEAFNMNVNQALILVGNEFTEFHEDSFKEIFVYPNTVVAVEENRFNDEQHKHFKLNFDSSMSNVSLHLSKFTKNVINRECKCDLFAYYNGHFRREELERDIYGKFILSFQCFDEGLSNWFDYDKYNCDKEHDHEHEHEHEHGDGHEIVSFFDG